MEGEKDATVQLGFVEVVPPEDEHVLLPEYLASKVGGKPSWIGGPLLDHHQAVCTVCDKRMPLLMQIYAPLNRINDQAYHRMIFVLCCKDPLCHKSASPPIRVFRAQLSKENDFIEDVLVSDNSEDDTIDEDIQEPSYDQFTFLEGTCEICGWKATKHCAKCKQMRYCEREHQVSDWKNGHNKECEKIIAEAGESVLQKPVIPGKPDEPIKQKRILYRLPIRERRFTNQILFKEFEIVTEQEDTELSAKIDDLQFRADLEGGRLLGTGNDPDEEEDEDEVKIRERTEEQLRILNEYNKNVATEIPIKDGYEDEDWAEKSIVDTTFLLFQEITSPSPDQVLRYSFGNNPLWVHSSGKPLSIPNCSCGAPRVFEFQILPQLLYYLGVEKTTAEESIDWGTLLVYSCSKSCSLSSGENVKEEFLWRQQLDRLR